MLFIAVILAMTGNSCSKRGGKYIDQGEIDYNLSYAGNVNVPLEFLPKNLTVTFKKDKILFELISSYGNSGITNLVNPETGIYDTYYSFLKRKYYYQAQADEIFPGFNSMDGMILKKTDKTAVICGYNCKNAEITLPSDYEKVFNIWYTDEINIKNFNASNPFHQIDGVLMSFFFFMGNTELYFDAETVYKKDIPDEAFERRGSYKRVSKEDINKFIANMINL